MIHMRISQAAELLECTPLQSELNFTGITTDSRQVVPGMLFAAFPGQAFDGHDYIQQAQERGAVAALVSRSVTTDLPLLQVADVQAALGVLAGHWRVKNALDSEASSSGINLTNAVILLLEIM